LEGDHVSVRSGVIAYRGRTVDARALVDNGKTSPMTQELVGASNTGAVLTGIAKLVQRVVLELLTDRGSLRYLPDRGTFLMPQLRAGLIRTSAELFTAFSSAAADVRLSLRNDTRDEDPADEKLQSIEMISAEIVNQTAIIRARVTSEAGENSEVYLPLTVSPTPIGV
jgi:hypothetical protein